MYKAIDVWLSGGGLGYQSPRFKTQLAPLSPKKRVQHIKIIRIQLYEYNRLMEVQINWSQKIIQ